MMDYMLSSHANHLCKDHHAQAWQSASDAKLAAGRHLLAALHQSQQRPFSPPAFHPHPHQADPLPLFPPTENSIPSAQTNCPDDVVFYVGKSRQPFHLNAQTLISGSAYFKRLLQHAHSPSSPTTRDQARPPIVIDCEEGTFESLLLLMRYRTLEALPPMSAAEIFRLKKEADSYGIHYAEPPSKSRAVESGDDLSDMSSIRSQLSSPSGSPKSVLMNMSPPKGAGRHGLYREGVPLTCNTPRRLAELPEFPRDLADPARLVLVSCLDQDKASIYTCDCIANSSRKQAGSRTQWALNFHHRHAFCTACGHRPDVSPKHFCEMFMAAAAKYYALARPGRQEPNCAWQVSSDSTCMLRFISSAGDGRDACGCSAGGGRAAKEAAPTIWAANCFYSHAFCTCCGEVAQGPVLLSLILALRYGGSNKVSTSATASFR